jgi:serine/threonine protein kinase
MNSDETSNHVGGGPSPSVAAVAVAEVLAQQEREWGAGACPPVEALLDAHPEFANNANAILELVCNEALLREERGERPALSDYQARFPDLAEPLRMQWEVDRALFSRRSGSKAEKPPDQTGDYVSSGALPITVAQSPDQLALVAAQAPAARRAVKSVGRYRIDGVLGKGGMGVAYRAWDPDLKRVVAVKTLRATDADDAEIARFRTESEAIARVRHPNIVQVFDVGEDDGQPFFAMEFCAGGSLSGRLKDAPLAPGDAAIAVEQIARGVEAAHRQNVIHRDLKPANVLLSRDPSAPAPGASTRSGGPTATRSRSDGAAAPSESVVYKVTDFGLAKALDADDGYTRTGAVMGTPCYMSPEQAFGHTKQIGTAADVYALGAILYECLTGRPPFQGATVADTLDQVRRREPVPVRQLQPKAPVDLETIALKCLQKEPARRYASAAELADDLLRYLERRPILARPIGPLARGWRWCRRNPMVAWLAFGVLVALTIGLTGTTAALLWALREKKAAENNLAESERSLRETFAAVNESFIQISDDRLLKEPQLLGLRRELLARSVPYFESFVAKRRNDPAWSRELALAMARLAAVSQLMDPPDVATAKWRVVIPLWERLLSEGADPAGAHLELAKVYVSLGFQECKANRWPEADRDLTAAVEHTRAVPDREARGYEALAFEASSLAYLASTAAMRNDAERGRALHTEALAVQSRAVQLFPGTRAQTDLGEIHFLRGQALACRGEFAAATAELATAEKLFRTVATTPCREQPIAIRNLASTLSELGLARWRDTTAPLKAIPAAAQTLAEANDLWDVLCRQHPMVFDYQIGSANVQFCVAQIGIQTEQFDHAERVAVAAFKLRTKLLAQRPGDPTLIVNLADSYAQLREISRLGQIGSLVDRSGAELDFLVKHFQTPGVPPLIRERIPPCSANRARLLTTLKRYDDARTEWDRAIRFAPPEFREEMARERNSVPVADKKP